MFDILRKRKRYDIEPSFIDRVLNKEHFYGKIMQNPDPFSTSVNNLKQPLYARNFFGNKIFRNI